MSSDHNQPRNSQRRTQRLAHAVERSVEIHASSVLALRARLDRLRQALHTQGGRILDVACTPGNGQTKRTARVNYALPLRFIDERWNGS